MSTWSYLSLPSPQKKKNVGVFSEIKANKC